MKNPFTLLARSAPILALCLSSACAAPARLPVPRFFDSSGVERKLVPVPGSGRAGTGSGDAVADGDRFAFPALPAQGADGSLIIDYRVEGVAAARVELVEQDGGGRRSSSAFELALSPTPISFFLPMRKGWRPLEIGFSLKGGAGVFRIEKIRLDPTADFIGFESSGGRIDIGPGCSIYPTSGGGKRLSLPIDAIEPGWYSLSIRYGSKKGGARLSGTRYGWELLAGDLAAPLRVPVRLGSSASFSLDMGPGSSLESFRLVACGDGPLPADPLTAIDWDKADFRSSGYELFRWDAVPGVLIFLFSDYAQQDLMLKRLAFYAEKAGFRGQLASDARISGLHGWNAHDYPASTLARFFSLAESTEFPLGQRELELRGLLEKNGVIKRGNPGWTEGSGAIISVSLESGRALRKRFIAHEAFHGIYFTDPEFRARVKEIWDGVSPELKAYILEFFDFKELDVRDPDLMANEFAAYFLQTPVDGTPGYFSTTVADFLERDRNGGGKYRRFAKAHLADFRSLAKALDAVVGERYGLAAGRVWRAE